MNSVRNGSWKGYIQQDEEGDYNASVIAIHSEYENELKNLKWDSIEEVIGVDSGQAGIYDYWLYRNDEFVGECENTSYFPFEYEGDKFYAKNCDLTTSTDLGAGVLNGGIVSSSGYGDGGYTAFLTKNKEGQVIGIFIQFLQTEDEEGDFL